nr:immunoglobulin heavy chain junction region [Macaca mulatta]
CARKGREYSNYLYALDSW